MHSAEYPRPFVYESGAFGLSYPCYMHGYPWVDSLYSSFSSWKRDSMTDWYTSCYPGLRHYRCSTPKCPWDMNSLKEALHAASTGTGEVADVIMSCDFSPREAAFTKIIGACGRWKDSKKALEVFQTMIDKSGLRPNTITYTALISACSSTGDCVAAMKVFKNMKTASMTDPDCQPNDVTYNKIITASECGGFHKFAVNCFQEMKDRGIEGDRAVYCSALHSCIQTQSWNEAELVLSIMHGKGFATSLENYAVMINYFGETRRMKSALNLFIEMQDLDQKVNRECCHSLMRAFELAERDDMAMDLLKSMWEAEISVEMPTYISALTVFALKDNMEDSLVTLERMTPDFRSISGDTKELILAAAKSSNSEIIVKNVEEFFDKESVEDVSSSSSSI